MALVVYAELVIKTDRDVRRLKPEVSFLLGECFCIYRTVLRCRSVVCTVRCISPRRRPSSASTRLVFSRGMYKYAHDDDETVIYPNVV